MLESNSLSHKFQDTVTESEVRKIHCSVVADVLDNEIKPHTVMVELTCFYNVICI